MQFSRLKLNGFKSFVDPTELSISAGVTGIVGPNGCGKSNLVEALRWVMGENSAKQIRGSEMDDVIFAGTASRSARNSATVELLLENTERDAPAIYNDGGTIRVSRHIERGAGSSFRINDKEVRARDQQLLFADASSGARSTAIVSQGQVGAVINAKPSQRRHLLEEAAGITGLHSRRHEAELRLKAAEGNVERLDDLLVALGNQLQALKRQARQASRYRSLSGRIRKAEAMLLYSRWAAAESDVDAASRELSSVQMELLAHEAETARATTDQSNAASVLPQLRKNESEAASTVHKLTAEMERIDDEVERVRREIDGLTAQLETVRADKEREKVLHGESATRLAELTLEAEKLRTEGEEESDLPDKVAETVERWRKLVAEKEAMVAALTEQLAAGRMVQSNLEQRVEKLNIQAQELIRKKETLAREKGSIDSRQQGTVLSEARDQLKLMQEKGRALRESLLVASAQRKKLNDNVVDQRRAALGSGESLQQLVLGVDRLKAELATLEKVIGGGGDEQSSAVSQDNSMAGQIQVASGYERAVTAALGTDLAASTEPVSSITWSLISGQGEGPSLPTGVRALSDFVSGPPALKRRLLQIGVVADQSHGDTLLSSLRQGQRLVSREGDLWRWDGFRRQAGALPSLDQSVSQFRRVVALRSQIGVREAELEKAKLAQLTREANLREQESQLDLLQEAEEGAQNNVHAQEESVAISSHQLAERSEALADDSARLQIVQSTMIQIEEALSDLEIERRAVEWELSQLPDQAVAAERLEEEKMALAAKRNNLEGELGNQQQVLRTQEVRAERLSVVADEASLWKGRGAGAKHQIEALVLRETEVDKLLEAGRSRPNELESKKTELVDCVTMGERRRLEAAEQLSEAENKLRIRDESLKNVTAVLANCREKKARLEGKLEQAVALRSVEEQQIRERLGGSPEEILGITEVSSVEQLPELLALEKQMERLLRERESMGAVNLRAGDEATELSSQVETLENEKVELLQAVAKLRSGIGSLNREGRQRLREAFEEVNGHFEKLFVRLFGGGRARLSLIGSEDPLEAGLEIMASPPGKRLQTLSLMSGGEKALAALSLLFAVFLTKPAPICVLDEVDAPLDDANVERFCQLVEEIANYGKTRFLVITHHRLTMAKMDRLYGVTMGESGVSQLVSVDLQVAGNLEAAE
ncbi:MAG: chromosome segregation protein SMC [Pseudomonadota bacterium]|nr:chromosome segregation protein SMC [Pseudomonadota bacterium]